MKYVYMLQSKADPERHYAGSTRNLKKRFDEHNAGHSTHTRKYLPWELRGYIAFSEPAKADKFEAYLKSGSGRAFAKKHF